MSSSDELEVRQTGARLLDRELDRPAALPLRGLATFRLLPDGAVLFHLEGATSWSTMRAGRYVALPDAVQALREIAERGGPWEARRARQGLGGWT